MRPRTSSETLTLEEIRERLDGVSVAMVSSVDERDTLSSRPMTVRRIDERGDVLFVVDRTAHWAIGGRPVNVALVDPGSTWLSIAGTTVIELDRALLEGLWDDDTDDWFEGDRGRAAVLRVRADRWEYWTAPNRIGRAVEEVKAFLMDREADPGDRGTIET